MYDIIQVTAQYSNAVLVAILPYVSNFTAELDLPIPTPVEISQVQEFRCSWRSDIVGGRVVLTNGYGFNYEFGRINGFESPRSYYSLQDPGQIPQFYGEVKISEPEAIDIARNAIKKMGYSIETLCVERAPTVIAPPQTGTNYVPRYRLRWFDSNVDFGDPEPTVEFEVDASTREIQMMAIYNRPATFRPQPKVNVQPTVLHPGPRAQPIGGRRVAPVSPEYSNAFLIAILPQITDYVRRGGFDVKTPITMNDVKMETYSCGLVEGAPRAFLHLKTGEHFIYGHGQVVSFYASDSSRIVGEEEARSNFRGPLNITTNRAIDLVRQTVIRLGYSLNAIRLDEPAIINPPNNHGINSFARYAVNWVDRTKGMQFLAMAEVDATSGKIKALSIKDQVNTNIWRAPPQVDTPIGSKPMRNSEPKINAATKRLFRDEINIHIIQSATSISAYKVAHQPSRSPDAKSIRGFPILLGPISVSQEIGDTLKEMLLAEQTYSLHATKCVFSPLVSLRFTRDDEHLDVLLCFQCNELRGVKGDSFTGSAYFSPTAEKLLELVKRIFPQEHEIQQLNPR